MQLDVIAVNVGEMLADLGDAYGKWHLTPGTMHPSSEGLACTRRGRGAYVNIVLTAFVQASYLALLSHRLYVLSASTARHLSVGP
tara:strand:- start:105 stop:359 length:255 start_codon:yes stop_codon:yes gene_type:complete